MTASLEHWQYELDNNTNIHMHLTYPSFKKQYGQLQIPIFWTSKMGLTQWYHNIYQFCEQFTLTMETWWKLYRLSTKVTLCTILELRRDTPKLVMWKYITETIGPFGKTRVPYVTKSISTQNITVKSPRNWIQNNCFFSEKSHTGH